MKNEEEKYNMVFRFKQRENQISTQVIWIIKIKPEELKQFTNAMLNVLKLGFVKQTEKIIKSRKAKMVLKSTEANDKSKRSLKRKEKSKLNKERRLKKKFIKKEDKKKKQRTKAKISNAMDVESKTE